MGKTKGRAGMKRYRLKIPRLLARWLQDHLYGREFHQHNGLHDSLRRRDTYPTDYRLAKQPRPASRLGSVFPAGHRKAISHTLDPYRDGATYKLGATVNASYECTDEDGGSGLKSCTGTVANGSPIDTAAEGTKTFTVTAEDNAGNKETVTHTYNVTKNGKSPSSGGGKGGGPKPK